MNEFEYRILDKKIDAFTTIKQHKECARELHKKLGDMGSAWNNRIFVDISKHGLDSYENIYKALRKVLKNYKGASDLPAFIYAALDHLHNKLTSQYIESNPAYERFIDVFQHDHEVDFGYLDTNDLKSLTLLVMDRKPHFTIKFEFKTSDIYNFASSGFNISSNLNKCLEVEELKRVLPQDVTYTVIEEALNAYYKNIVYTEDTKYNTTTTKSTMPRFVKAMENLVTVSKTACERINRENFG